MSSKYGVRRILPNGQINPEWRRRQYRAVATKRGVKPHPPPKFNTPAKLPSGKHNPEYDRLWRRSKGIPPRKKRGDNKHGVPAYLDDGSFNPEYYRQMYHHNKKLSKPRKLGKYGIPSTLPDGRTNPEYSTAIRRAHGAKPMAKSKYGVPTKLPDGSRNPEYSKLRYKAEKNRIKVVHKKYLQSPEGKLSNSKCKTKWRALPPLKIIIGQPFDGAELHHMSKTVGIWVPKWVNHLMYHNVWTGKNIDKINLVAIQWYIENAAVRRAAARGAVSKKRESRLPHTPPVI